MDNIIYKNKKIVDESFIDSEALHFSSTFSMFENFS